MGKTKILQAVAVSPQGDENKSETIYGDAVEVLSWREGVNYLGGFLSFGEYHEAEIKHRMAKAWKKFGLLQKELCNKACPLIHRIRVFEATVTATALYGCVSWTMTPKRERILKTTQRSMLR